MIHQGDCVEVMAGMDAASVDAIVTDPPSGAHFMGRDWDHDKGGRTQWVAWMTDVMRECYRVLKPGHWMLCWALPRTSHWTAWAIEDAGFKVTDCIHHVFASGFPKGRGQLKPAYEPWWLCRKPGPLRELGIDAARIGTEPRPVMVHNDRRVETHSLMGGSTGASSNGEVTSAGRWPANVVLTDPIFDGGWDGVVGGGEASSHPQGSTFGSGMFTAPGRDPAYYGDTGTYSRFFLIPKASRSDREPLLPGELEEGRRSTDYGGMPTRVCNVCGDRTNRNHGRWPACGHEDWRWDEQLAVGHKGGNRRNTWPTVKPTALMRHLVRLVTPPNTPERRSIILDPFLGSGSTALACELEGYDWLGIEREDDAIAIAEQRLKGVQRGLGLDVEAPTPRVPNTHPDLSKHRPKVRAPSDTYSGNWGGTTHVGGGKYVKTEDVA